MAQKKVERPVGGGFANKAKSAKPQDAVADAAGLDKLAQLNVPPVDKVEEKPVDEGTVTVLCGANDQVVKAGVTIAQIRKSLKDTLNIADDAEALIDSENVTEDTIVKKNSVVEFIKLAGTKGTS
jgi:hypothetical protein